VIIINKIKKTPHCRNSFKIQYRKRRKKPNRHR